MAERLKHEPIGRLAVDSRLDPPDKGRVCWFAADASAHPPSRDALLAMIAQSSNGGFEASVGERSDPSAYEAVSPSDGLSIHTEVIESRPDGNRVNLQIVSPGGPGPFPCIYYIHGGGMMMSSCYDPNYSAWGRLIARCGVVVVQVDFRNALFPSSLAEIAPFPAGLNDCVSGLRWTHAHAAELNIDPLRIIIEGESGGANLTIATALKLKRDGDLGLINGLYVGCPYLAGDWPGAEGSSALENAGILMDVRTSYGAVAYGIDELHRRNPLAWPGFATEEDVAGFPPVVVVVNECDPLRDDGVAFYRLLLRAGLSARCKQLMGTVHGTEIYVLMCPDISRDEARAIAAFAAG